MTVKDQGAGGSVVYNLVQLHAYMYMIIKAIIIIIVCIANTAIDHAKCMGTPTNSYRVLVILSYIIGLPMIFLQAKCMQNSCLIMYDLSLLGTCTV